MRNSVVILDAGHGGLNPQGQYTTAPSKQFKHDQGEFHGNGWFYEGVFNREITYRVKRKLDDLDIRTIKVFHPYLDYDLNQRVDMANWYSARFEKSLYISNHANASVSHRGQGFEIFTSPGETGADQFAKLQWDYTKKLVGKRIKYRKGSKRKTPDKEANFFVLRKTIMPAILVEWLFFDNYEDALKLMDEQILDLFAESQVRATLDMLSSM